MLSDKQSGKNVFEVLRKFAECSGLKINRDKTEGLWLGNTKENVETPFDIAWPKTPIKLLGVYLSYDKELAIRAKFDDKIEKLKRQLHWWKSRNLSLLGRVLIVKTLGLSKFAMLCSMIHIPVNVVNKVNKIVYEYIKF